MADARREFHHQLSTRIIRDHQAIAVEDLAVKGLARTRLAKSVHDAGWSAFVTCGIWSRDGNDVPGGAANHSPHSYGSLYLSGQGTC